MKNMVFNEQYVEKKKELVKNLTDIKETEQLQLDTRIQDALLKSKIEETTSLEEVAKGFKNRNEYLLDPNSGYSKKQEVSNMIKILLVPELLGNDTFDGKNASENLRLVLRGLQKLGFIKTEEFNSGALTGLIRFQKRMGLTPDGLTGTKTLESLISELGKRRLVVSILPEGSVEGKKNDPLDAGGIKLGNGEPTLNKSKDKSILEGISFETTEEKTRFQKERSSIVNNKDYFKTIINKIGGYKTLEKQKYIEKNPFYAKNGKIKRDDYSLDAGIADTVILDNLTISRKEKKGYPSLKEKDLKLLADYLNQEYRKINNILEPIEKSA